MKKIHLTIPQPCHENWDQMMPRDKGRFCVSCQKTVVDFSEMTDTQLAQFFKKPAESICGRFHHDQLEREITLSRKTLPWIRYFFQFSLPAFLICLKSQAQKTQVRGNTIENISRVKTGKYQASEVALAQSVEGYVIDSSGNPVPYASVILNASRRGVVSDSNGHFQTKLEAIDTTIIVSAVGYSDSSLKIENGTMRVVLRQENSEMEPVIIDAGRSYWLGGLTYRVSKVNSFPLLEKITDTIAPSFLVYPNPAPVNSLVKLQANKLATGGYTIFLFDSKGAVVKISDLVINNKGQVEELSIGNIASGKYLICLKNKTTGKQYTKKLIVQ